MIRLSTIATGLALTFVLLGPVSADGERPSGYLATEALPNSLTLVPPPPADGSEAAKADRAGFQATRALKDSPRWTQAAADAELFGDKAHASFACAAGVSITTATTPTLSRMMDRLVIDAGRSTGAAKDHYKRARPMIGNDAPLCVPREDWMVTNGSYPSGHSAAGWAWALVLAEVVPAKADAILLRGREYGDSRAICGVHFASDVEAGRIMGAATVARLHSEPAFLKDLEAARAEAAKAPPPTGCASN